MNTYEKYAIIDAKIKELTAEKDGLRVEILQEMIDKGETKVSTTIGSFTVTPLKKWTYPENVMKIGEDFKAAKALAESTEEATYVEEPSLRFTQIKL